MSKFSRSLALLGCSAAVLIGLAAPSNAAGNTAHVTCKGSTTSCTAKVNIAGGASNKHVIVKLPAKGMRLESLKPNHKYLEGAYLVSEQKLRGGGLKYTFTLSAAEASKGATLNLKFHKPGKKNPMIVQCTGAGTACKATVPITGGKSNRRVIVQLPRTDLGLVSVTPSRRTLQGAYSLSNQHLRAGDTEYTFILNAAKGAAKGSHLTLAFAS